MDIILHGRSNFGKRRQLMRSSYTTLTTRKLSSRKSLINLFLSFHEKLNLSVTHLVLRQLTPGHWLAIEGVQPAIVQNPTPADLKSSEYQGPASASGPQTSSLAASSGADRVETKQQVKHVLSRELQLYFERIANALVNDEMDNIQETALASLRNDPGLHQLVPYLVAFIAEKVNHSCTKF